MTPCSRTDVVLIGEKTTEFPMDWCVPLWCTRWWVYWAWSAWGRKQLSSNILSLWDFIWGAVPSFVFPSSGKIWSVCRRPPRVDDTWYMRSACEVNLSKKFKVKVFIAGCGCLLGRERENEETVLKSAQVKKRQQTQTAPREVLKMC